MSAKELDEKIGQWDKSGILARLPSTEAISDRLDEIRSEARILRELFAVAQRLEKINERRSASRSAEVKNGRA